jgi:tetratricopeptide (TPR) repeat protein
MDETDPAFERALLLELEHGPGPRRETLERLAIFYHRTGRPKEALRRLREMLPLIADAEEKALYLMRMGVLCEDQQDYQSAVQCYRDAMAMEPADPETWYFIHNNLGYSLNQLGLHAEAEPYCRTAVGILPERPNAHKNLGLALAGQGRPRQAAECFIEATRVRPEDPRSCAHLEDLLELHPELKAEFQQSALQCRTAVTTARVRRQQNPRPS